MYGTIFHMKTKPGAEQNIVNLFEEWNKERKPNVKGAIAGFLMKLDKDSNELIGVAVFSDKESYIANAENPEQDAWYRELRENLEEDPTWEDGEYISASL